MAFKRPPSLPIARSNDELMTVYNQAITDLEQYLLEITQPAETGFTTSNVTPNKSLDPTSAMLPISQRPDSPEPKWVRT